MNIRDNGQTARSILRSDRLALAAAMAAVAAISGYVWQRRPSVPAVEATAGHHGGAGTPLLLLHGVGGTWRVWRPVLPGLQAHHEVFAPTLPGHAGAEPLATGREPSIEALTDGVESTLDRHGLGQVHIAGNSLGGWIALELARRNRARSVVLFGPAGGWDSDLRMAMLASSMRLSFAVLRRLAPIADNLAAWPAMRRLLLASQVAHPELMDPDELAANIRAVSQSPVIGPLLRTLTNHPVEPLVNPRCPVRIVWAEHDRVIPFSHYGAALLARVPSAELIRLPGVGHVPMSDAPHEVARLITELTDSVDSRQTAQQSAAARELR